MPEFNELTLLPLCAGLTLVGLIASWAAWRRRGAHAGIRGVAWSLLPVSLYLTGLLELLWAVVKAVSAWVLHLVFSPTVWAGVALFGVSVVLFVLAGAVRSRWADSPAGRSAPKTAGPAAGELTTAGPAPASAEPAKSAGRVKPTGRKQDSSEFDEIEDILKRRGIN